MARDNHLEDLLAADQNRFIVVRPCGGVRSGYEARNAFNEDVLHRGEDLDDVVEQARERAGYGGFDHILVVREPEPPEHE